MRRAVYMVLLVLLGTGSGCWKDAVDNAASTTAAIDRQYAQVFVLEHNACLDSSTTRLEYNECMLPWHKGAAHIARLREVTLSLDHASGRRARKTAACEWFRAVARVHEHLPLPATLVAVRGKWRRKC